MRRCLINLTRFGDLLQTQPVIRAFRKQGDQVSLICLENFAAAAELLDGLDQVLPLPGSAILASLGRDWRLCTDSLATWVRDARAALQSDEILNLTPSAGSRLLGRLMSVPAEQDLTHSAPLKGFGMDAHGFGKNGSPWGSYVQAVTARRGCSPFNLADGFFRMAGCTGMPDGTLRAPTEEALDKARELICRQQEQYLPADAELPAGYVAFQLGASKENRRWPVEYFAVLGKIVWEHARMLPLLLGTAEERPLAEQYHALGGPGLNLAGKTSLPILAATLRQCRLLITNDTGTMHLAAGQGIPILAVFLATAQPWDTGPYREHSCSLEPRMDCHPCAFNVPCPHGHACRHSISPEALAELALNFLHSGKWEPTEQLRHQARVWLSERDDAGFMNLRSLSGDDATERGLWLHIQRDFYRHFLDKWSSETGHEIKEEKISPSSASLSLFPPESPLKLRLLTTAEKASGTLLLALEQGRLLKMRNTEKHRTAFLATCARLSAIFSESSDFIPLSLIWRTALQEHGGDLSAMFHFFDLLRGELSSLTRQD